MATNTVTHPALDLHVVNMYWDGGEGNRFNDANLNPKPWVGRDVYLAGRGSATLSLKVAQAMARNKISIYSYGDAADFGREMTDAARELGNKAGKINIIPTLAKAIEKLELKENANAILQITTVNLNNLGHDSQVPDLLEVYIFNKPDKILERYTAAQMLLTPESCVTIVNSALSENSPLPVLMPTVIGIKGRVIVKDKHLMYYDNLYDVLRDVYGLVIK